MVCPKCGFYCSDEAAFCSSCGYRFNEQDQPVVPAAKAKSAPGKTAGRLIPITFILTVILLVVSILLPLITDIAEIPVAKLVFEAAGVSDEFDDIKEDLQDIEEEMEHAYDRYKHSMSSKEKRLVKNVLNETEKLSDNFSLLNFCRLVAAVNKGAHELEDYLGDDVNLRDLEQIEGVLTIVLVAVCSMFLLPLIFTLRGGLLKNRGLTITALVFMVLTQLIWCGILWAVLSLVIYITQAVLCGKARQAKLAASAS